MKPGGPENPPRPPASPTTHKPHTKITNNLRESLRTTHTYKDSTHTVLVHRAHTRLVPTKKQPVLLAHDHEPLLFSTGRPDTTALRSPTTDRPPATEARAHNMQWRAAANHSATASLG